jgi:protein TonB
MNTGYEVVRPDEPKQSNRGIILVLFSVIIVFVGVYFLYGNEENVKKGISETVLPTAGSKESIQLKPKVNLALEHEETIKALKNEHLLLIERLSKDIESRQEYIYKLEEEISSLESENRKLQSSLNVALLDKDKALLKIEQTEFQLTQERAKFVASEKPTPSESVSRDSLASSGKTSQTMENSNNKVPTQSSSDNFTKYKLISAPPPSFPKRAQYRGKEGSALVDYTIMISGNVTNVRLLNESPKGWGFGQAAVQAAKRLKYNPSTRDGNPVTSAGISREYKFSFAD